MLTLITLFILYFLPTIVGRHKRDALGIFIINLLFGWTLIGWIIALMWACAAEPCVTFAYVPANAVPVAAVPAGTAMATAGRYCYQCGAFAPARAHYCPGCGRTL